ncbi:MAG TPA: Calx-beta domain-containing protein, partial [Sphingomicrobium sp.]|nr:Calx-beta domain-containing protein [Sphingomicrobium sp.]
MSMVYFNLSGGDFFQDWSNVGLITSNDDWSGVPSITGHLGDSSAASTTNVDPRTLTTDAGVTIDVIANQLNDSSISGGVAELELTDPAVALQGSGTADAPYLVVYLDTTGRQAVNVQFDARDMDSSADNAAQQINVQYRVGGTGPWINVIGGYVADVTTGGTATQVTHLNVTLPAEAQNQAMVEVRIMTTNASGSDEWVGIDNIAVTSTALDVIPVQPGTFSIDDVTAVEGDSGSTAFSFTVTRSGGSDGAVSVNYTLQNGTTNAADFTSTAGGTVSFADGETSKIITIDVAGDLEVEPSETFTVVLDTPTGGATITDGSGLGTITS